MTSLLRRLWYRVTQVAPRRRPRRRDRDAPPAPAGAARTRGPLPRRRGAGQPARPRQRDAGARGGPRGMDLRVDRARLAGPRAGRARAAPQQDVHAGRGRHARARHRRQHRAVLDLQQPAAARAAGTRAGPPRHPRRGLVDVSDLAGRRGADRRRSSRAPSPTPTSSWISRPRDSVSRSTPPTPAAGCSTCSASRRSAAGCCSASDDRPDGERPRGGDQPPLLAARATRGADSAIGATLTLDRQPFTIVGVMPASFAGPDVGRLDDVVIPFAAEPILRGVDSGLDERTDVVARDHGPPEARREPRAGQRRAA